MDDSFLHYQELALGSRLKRFSDNLMKEVAKVYTHLGIDFDPYYMPIFKLVSEQDKLTIGAISNLLNVTQPAVTQYINVLEKRKLIICFADKTDKRKKKISLSPTGKTMLHQLKPVWNVIDAELKLLTHHPSNKTLLDHVTYVENEIKQNPLSNRILLKL